MTLQEKWLDSYDQAEAFADEPPYRTCATMAYNQTLMERNPVFRTLLSELEVATTTWLEEPVPFGGYEEIVIPVVVHVVWSDIEENISDAQIRSQIEALNEDFGASNASQSSIPAVWANLSDDSGIRFKLADRDPKGNRHHGIDRVHTTEPAFGTDDKVKHARDGGADAWPAESYLNLWVCNLDGGTLGYAQFPGAPPETDGVVVGFRFFGREGTAAEPFGKGRTATHEVGHWLNLRHIWGDTEDCLGSDLVLDTPTQRLPNYGTPSFPTTSCHNEPDGDMFMNYMDYVNDEAMFFFTAGQVARMRATLDTMRIGLQTSAGLDRGAEQ